MKAILFTIRVNSLYSIRIPFTWQSALTYPVLPPSTVIGLVANALQRYKNDRHPREYLEEIEQEVVWAGSRLITPCVIKSYTTSAITKWEEVIGGKFTNALSRQFAYSKNLQAIVIFKPSNVVDEIAKALISSPLTCGDSESSITLESAPEIKEVEELIDCKEIDTFFPVPFVKEIETIGGGILYLMHEKCLKREGEEYPLRSYIVPLRDEKGILHPTTLRVKGEKLKVYRIIKDTPLDIIYYQSFAEKMSQKKKEKTKKKK